MDHRIIQITGISERDESAWRSLATRATEPNPFSEPDCILPAARHQPNGDQLKLIVAENDGHIHACMPFRFTGRGKVPYPLVTGNVRRMHWLGTPLVDSYAPVEAVESLLLGLAGTRRMHRGRILLLEWLVADGPVAAALRSAAARLRFPVATFESFERGLAVRRLDDDYEAIHSKKMRYNLRRQRRLLGERLGGDVKIVDRSEDPTAPRDYLCLEGSGYKGQSGVAMATVPGEPEYFLEMCERFAERGRLRIFALECSGQTVAMEVWVSGGKGMFLPKISYDEEYAEFGPGVVLQTAVLEGFFGDSGAEWLDTCTYEGNVTLLRLYPERRKIQSLYVVLGHNPIDRTAVASFRKAKRLHRRWYTWRNDRKQS